MWLCRSASICSLSIRDRFEVSTQADRDITQLDQGRDQLSAEDERAAGRRGRAAAFGADDGASTGHGSSSDSTTKWGRQGGGRMGVAAGNEEGTGGAIAEGSGDSRWRGGFSNSVQSEASLDSDWTANDDWLDALGLGVGPSPDEAAPAGADRGLEDAATATLAGVSAASGTSAEDHSEQLAGASGAEQSSAADRNRGEEGTGSDNGWFFDGSRVAAAVADPAQTRQGEERLSDRRKAAVNGSGGGFESQRARGADDQGWRGTDGRRGRGRRSADGAHRDLSICKTASTVPQGCYFP